MKKLVVAVLGSLLLVACGSEEPKEVQDNILDEVALVLCDCTNPLPENEAKCAEQFPTITDADIAACSGDTIVSLDSLSQEEKDSVRADYENDLSLEIKEIEEEKEDPISDECREFLEEYADEIKSFTKITEKISENPDDIGLQIQFSSASEEINSWASKPQMFQCSQNAAFQKQIEILNGKRDKLLEM